MCFAGHRLGMEWCDLRKEIKMTKNKSIFADFKLFRMLGTVVICGALVASPAFAAGDGCDDENNDRITPELALCSVHAYNIGEGTNPTGSDKQLMKDVVALKTTVITQQMNKQYEYMEAMIRRFKTQLEKAVLTTKLQAAGAAPSSSDGDGSDGTSYSGGTSGMSGGRKNNGLSNAEDCVNSYTSYPDVYQCLLRNIGKIQSAVTAGDMGAARRQLKIDLETLGYYNRLTLNCANGQQNCRENQACKQVLDTTGAQKTTCARAQVNGSRREDISTCVGQMRACIVANNDDYTKSSNNQSRQ